MNKSSSVSFLAETSWRARSFHFLEQLSTLPLPGAWRVHKLGKRLVGTRYIQTDCGQFRIWICPSHLSGLQLLANEHPERMLLEIARHFVASRASFVDIGANIGLATVEAAGAIQSQQRLIAFEPEPRMFEVLRANCELNGIRAELHPVALGRDEGDAELFVSTTGNQGNHSLFSRPGNGSSDACRVATLDRVFDEEPFQPALLLVKIDTEGAESWVLRGGRRWLGHRDELAILCEVSPENLERAGSSVAELEQLFEELGIESTFLLDEANRELKTIDSLASLDQDWANVLVVKGEGSKKITDAFARHLESRAQPTNSAD